MAELFELYGQETIAEPDMIVKDTKNDGTVFLIKFLPDCNINIVVRLALETEDKEFRDDILSDTHEEPCEVAKKE